MPDDQSSYDDTPIVNTEKLEQLLSFYKFPLILAVTGIGLLIFTIGIFLKNQTATSNVVFESQASPSANIKIKVDIEGAVISPGVYELAQGGRIADVLTFAGGLSADADRDWVAKNLNRAAKLVDGAKIYIPSEGELSSGKTSSSSLPAEASAKAGLSNSSDLGNLAGIAVKTVNLNTASSAELEALPGIGPATAAKIISGRPYQTVDELKTRKIINNSLYEKLKDSFVVF